MGIVNVIIQLVSGALGGNAAGALLKKLSLGTALNSLLGLVRGGLGGQLLTLLGVFTTTGATDIGSIIGSVAGGGVGGGVLMAIVGAIKKAVSK